MSEEQLTRKEQVILMTNTMARLMAADPRLELSAARAKAQLITQEAEGLYERLRRVGKNAPKSRARRA
jgi:hypothetical protein